MPKISVIITTYGGSKKIRRAIKSVQHQGFKDYEIIVVDDNDPGSDSRTITESILEEFVNSNSIIYIKHDKNLNGSAARNTGIKRAKGKYICFLDDDDFYLKDRLKISYNCLEANPSYVAVCMRTGSLKGRRLTKLSAIRDNELKISEILSSQYVIGTGSNIFVRKDIINEIGGFDDRFPRFQDIEFMIRVLEKGPVRYLSDLGIFKEASDVRVINYNNLKIATDLFIDKFKYLINDMNGGEEVIKDKLRAVYYAAVLNANPEDISDAKMFCSKYNVKSEDIVFRNNRSMIIKHRLKLGPAKKLYILLLDLKNIRSDYRIKKNIGKDLYNEIKTIMDFI